MAAIFLLFLKLSEAKSLCTHAASRPPNPNYRWEKWSTWCNENWLRKAKYSEKTCPSANQSTASPPWTELELNPSCCGEKPPTNCLSYSTTYNNATNWRQCASICMLLLKYYRHHTMIKTTHLYCHTDFSCSWEQSHHCIQAWVILCEVLMVYYRDILSQQCNVTRPLTHITWLPLGKQNTFLCLWHHKGDDKKNNSPLIL
jgi:hypothetical protein